MQLFKFVVIYVIIRVSYLQSLYSIVVHGYVVHSVLASNNYYYSAGSVYVKTGRRNHAIL